MTATYAFRDSDVAAARLELVAELFEASSRAFVAEQGPSATGLAVDLGCGPGHTTRLLAEELVPRLTIGLDVSERFLELASSISPELEFVQHDATSVPLPSGPADLLYCRFLLSHLSDPVGAVIRWASQLRPRGRLLLEEVEWIRTEDPALGRYLDTVRRLLMERGHRLEVGALVADVEPPGLRRRVSRVVTLAPDPSRVAWMFLLNLRAWRDDPLLDPAEVAALEAELAAGPRDEITWGLRQIAYGRMA